MKKRVFDANLKLKKENLVKLTWGNVSEINRELGLVVIKPSGVEYSKMEIDDMVVIDLKGNEFGTNKYKASSDLPTHIELYKQFFQVQSIVHTHSTEAVKWAQAGREIPVYGTTHADSFYGSIPCTRKLTKEEVVEYYEKNTGSVIIETFSNKNIKPSACSGVIVNGHGPFTWSCKNTEDAVQNSIILEEIAVMALGTETLNPKVTQIETFLMDKHYYRKHGEDAYYGQKI